MRHAYEPKQPGITFRFFGLFQKNAFMQEEKNNGTATVVPAGELMNLFSAAQES